MIVLMSKTKAIRIWNVGIWILARNMVETQPGLTGWQSRLRTPYDQFIFPFIFYPYFHIEMCD